MTPEGLVEYLQVLLFYRQYYLSIKKLYGKGFGQSLAGYMLSFTERRIEEILKSIDISDAFSKLEH